MVIPPKRATGVPHRAYQGISDDGRFVYVANMTPATSVSVVDVVARKFVTEIEMSGCNLVYPIGNRAFASLCGDGTVQVVTLDDQGNLKGRGAQREVLRSGQGSGHRESVPLRQHVAVLLVRRATCIQSSSPAARRSPAKRGRCSPMRNAPKGWKVGGAQFNAIHKGLGRLFVIVHQGGPYGHKDPGQRRVDLRSLRRRKSSGRFRWSRRSRRSP